MRSKTHRFAGISLAVLTLSTSLFAQASAPQVSNAASSPQSVPLGDYRALKREVDQLKNRVDSQDKQLAATTQPTTQPAAAHAAIAPSGSSSNFFSNNNVGQEVKTLFAPRTEKEYFSPFDIMDPAHMRADMPMQIGGWQDMNLYMGLQTVGRLQALQQQNVSINHVRQAGLDPGFQDPFANLSFLAAIPDKMDVYFDLYVASRPHASTMYGHEGYLLFKELPAPFDTGPIGTVFDYINVKVGAFDLDFGDDNYRRSNNARVQRNPLIGNPLLDPNVEEIGGEVDTIKGPVYALFGVGSGTTTEHFDYGSQPSFHGKLWAYPLPDVRTSVSAYHVNLAGSADTSYFFSTAAVAGRSPPSSEAATIPDKFCPRPAKT